jgi:hydrogenase maturation protein HypF
MAENRITGNVIGLAIDGTGWGPDETVWGGELLLADETRFTRLGCLLPVRMPGGAISIRKPWRMALSYLKETFGSEFKKYIPSSWEHDLTKDELSLALYQLDDYRLSPLSSSCGRLFDSVAALAGVCTNALYEGQPAIELEQTIDRNEKSSYEFSLEEKSDFLYISWKPVIEGIMKDLRCGEKAPAISSRFHNGLSEALTAACISLSRKTGVNRIALSGGCFMNIYLLSLCASKLERAGLTVLIHTRVPCNDGGISLGQLVIAAHGSE